MTESTTAVDTPAVAKKDPDGEVDAELVARLVEQARAAGRQPTGEGGLLQQLAKRFFRRRSSLRTVGSGVKPRLNR